VPVTIGWRCRDRRSYPRRAGEPSRRVIYDAPRGHSPSEPADAEAIRQIYNIEVTGSTATLDLVPRTPEEQASWMVAHSGVYPVIVADEGGQVVGICVAFPVSARAGYASRRGLDLCRGTASRQGGWPPAAQ